MSEPKNNTDKPQSAPDALKEALDQLAVGLHEGQRVFSEEAGKERAAVIHSLAEVIRFIWRFQVSYLCSDDLGVDEVSERLSAPLLRLLVALENLEEGKVEPILEKTKTEGGGPPDLTQQELVRALAVFAVEKLMQLQASESQPKITQLDACRDVADTLRSAGIRNITDTTITNWCYRVRLQPEESLDKTAAAELYSNFKSIAEIYVDVVPGMTSQELLDRIGKAVGYLQAAVEKSSAK